MELYCHRGWMLTDMIEKEVKKRVEKELRIRALKKAQDEIGKK